jgi:hypothetical protein
MYVYLEIYFRCEITFVFHFEQVEETTENGLIRTKFAETFPMSTYIAAWAVVPDSYATRSDDPDEPMVYFEKYRIGFNGISILDNSMGSPTTNGTKSYSISLGNRSQICSILCGIFQYIRTDTTENW